MNKKEFMERIKDIPNAYKEEFFKNTNEAIKLGIHHKDYRRKMDLGNEMMHKYSGSMQTVEVIITLLGSHDIC